MRIRFLMGMAIYLDCAATTPLEPRVREAMLPYLDEEFGNAGSRTHDYGSRAKKAVEHARDQMAAVVSASRGEVIFTSGATESNNLALLGLTDYGFKTAKTHVVSTQIEHHAVLEPLQVLAQRGFEVTLLKPNSGGWVEPEDVKRALRKDTLLVSIMHVNNETGVIQPVEEIAGLLVGHPAHFHVDAAQGFGKEIAPLKNKRIDLISISGHKIYAPKGIGALVARRRGDQRPPLTPLMHGGGQELGVRPGTLPVHLIVALGKAGELAIEENDERGKRCRHLRDQLLVHLESLRPEVNGDPRRSIPQILNISFPGLDSETVIEAWKELVAISDGAACTSTSYTCSHVLTAMGLHEQRIEGAVRLSWCHMTEIPNLQAMTRALASHARA